MLDLDFFEVVKDSSNPKKIDIYPRFNVGKVDDLLIRGKDFYAYWDEELGLWSTDENDLIKQVDLKLQEQYELQKKSGDVRPIIVKYMRDNNSGSIDAWHKYVQKQMRDNCRGRQLDRKVIFSDTPVTRDDFASKRLPYAMKEGDSPAWDELLTTLYNESEATILKWAIGAIILGEAKDIQKCIILYGEPGSGKGTILTIIQGLLEGYWESFESHNLGANKDFAMESFKSNPLLAIETDGDLSDIKSNTLLNSIISHEWIEVNEKFKAKYKQKFDSFLIMGTNKPVKITDSKSGLLRRVLDVNPSGRKIPRAKYDCLIKQVKFEYGAIAYDCVKTFEAMGASFYDAYIPITMMAETNDFYNFMDTHYEEFVESDEAVLSDIWVKYKEYCDMINAFRPMSLKEVKSELKTYFRDWEQRGIDKNGNQVRNLYSGFRTEKFKYQTKDEMRGIPKLEEVNQSWLKFNTHTSIFDIMAANYPAQYTNEKGTPLKKWSEVTTKLEDIDTSKLHYVKLPKAQIIVDFDLKDGNGNKSFEKNLIAASKWPQTYGELSKSGAGIHLHYIYEGDVSKLSRVYDNDIEIKVFTGNSSLRRQLTKCNDIQIATINSGLPFKEEKTMVSDFELKNEAAIRTMIKKNLHKEYHAYTKPSVDYIYDILEKAYISGISYDVSDLKQAVIIFASGSNHQATECLKKVAKMKFKSEEIASSITSNNYKEAPIVFFDVEVFPNLLLINWKFENEDYCHRMINPSPEEVYQLSKYRLIGFNCRRYDNHICYARMQGYSNIQLFNLSQQIVSGSKGANSGMFGNAYNFSYTDIFDYSSDKKSLKKWEIDIIKNHPEYSSKIKHHELNFPWDQPVPEDKWEMVAEYCDDDVFATEAVWNLTQGDFLAREILADIAGLSVNDTTNTLTTRIIFGTNKKPNLIYTNLATGVSYNSLGEECGYSEINKFEGYEYVNGHNIYKGYDVGKGGLVMATPGMYGRSVTLDVASMHPNSTRILNLFGENTKNFVDLIDTRILIKHKDFESAKKMFGGKLEKYLNNENDAKALSKALKIAINSVYGLTSASFKNPFKDSRNVNNIVALRGALFMYDLKEFVESKGFTVIHIKTDSIKIADPTDDILREVCERGKKYGYTFEVEATWEKICLVNNAVFIGKEDIDTPEESHRGKWTATGTQFQRPYVFKTLFSKEPIIFEDMCETKAVKSAIYLDYNENLGDEHQYKFIGKVGLFCPIKPGNGAAELVAEREDKKTGGKKYDSVTGAKGYRWLEAEEVKERGLENEIDKSYYISEVDAAVEEISKYGDFEAFAN